MDDVDVLQPHQNEILTWEIVGDIKSSPEDFIVREIGWAPSSISMGTDCNSKEITDTTKKKNVNEYRRKPGWHRCIAGLECNHHISEQSSDDLYVGGRDMIIIMIQKISQILCRKVMHVMCKRNWIVVHTAPQQKCPTIHTRN